MKVNDIIKNLEILGTRGDLNRFVSDIQYDSRKIEKDQAFIAIKGYQTDGHRFVSQAYENGARVFFSEEKIDLPEATVVYLKDNRKALPIISRTFFHQPDKKLKIIGITGTNGKTTTAYLTYSILQKAHWKPGLFTTVKYFDGKAWHNSERTTPESLDLFRIFYRMTQAGLKSMVMEVSSHALSLSRVEGVHFLAGVFTNLGRDHLDFHQTQENYFLAKRRLFEGMNESQRAVLNEDDPYSERIKHSSEAEIYTYSLKNPAASVSYVQHQVQKEGLQVKLKIPSGEITIKTKFLGTFNIYNIMAATATGVGLGIPDNFMVEGIESLMRVPGRCEHYPTPDGYSVYIDYAHTPDALQNILHAVWETRPQSLIVVFGAGGDRDRGKRPVMGKAAEDYGDKIILTNDNPRSEDPMAILNDILAGISDKSRVLVIPDRREAIHTGLKMARNKDSVVVAGKGHENYQEIKGIKYPFDDREVLKEFFERRQWIFPAEN
ncbi:MAG: UDP-N-acetylmuramoyl-L-alanyl-D-glutamate--2,6-diaminopimelate ligase [Caldithrix sp. RBG_13_44_9]|nr:MAG: UDP-N-acetylmuramoyl-L-alanyl-D-glutamate--2,6-diaminopimelate ligase [Caldithrix sp. RBG_13_44_9]